MTDKNIDMAVKIASLVSEQGGTAYFVGGYVRDKIRHKKNKDIDIEIHGIYPHQLASSLDSLGERISIGESFGIYNLKGYSLIGGFYLIFGRNLPIQSASDVVEYRRRVMNKANIQCDL